MMCLLQIFLITTLSVETGGDDMKSGNTVVLPVTLRNTAERLNVLVWGFASPQGVTIVGVSLGPVGLAAGKSVVCNPAKTKCMLLGFSRAGMADGVVAKVQVRLGDDFKGGQLRLTNISASTADGRAVYVEAR